MRVRTFIYFLIYMTPDFDLIYWSTVLLFAFNTKPVHGMIAVYKEARKHGLTIWDLLFG